MNGPYLVYDQEAGIEKVRESDDVPIHGLEHLQRYHRRPQTSEE